MRETSDLEMPESIPSAATRSSTERVDQREERTLAQLRDSQVDVTGLRGQHPWPRTVALVGAGLGPLVTGGTDELRGFGLDEFLQDRADRLADQIDRLAGA
jgi:hypothetical protein